MDELIELIYAHLNSDDGPDLGDDDPGFLLGVAQSIAEAIVSAGWPKKEGAS